MILMYLMDGASFGLFVDTIQDGNYDSSVGLFTCQRGQLVTKKTVRRSCTHETNVRVLHNFKLG